MAEHTPTPWKVTEDPRGEIVRAADSTGRPIASMWMNGDDMKGNAAFIVNAVNSHDALVKALTKSRQWVEANTAQVRGVSDQAAAPGEAMLSEIDAALASVKETSK